MYYFETILIKIRIIECKPIQQINGNNKSKFSCNVTFE
jgi:hypothetical protein